MTTGSGVDAPITAGSMPQGANRSGPGAIASGRAPAAGPSSGTCRRHATLRIVLGTLPLGVAAFVAAFAAMASPIAFAFVVEAAATAGFEFLGRALPFLIAVLPPFPLAVVGAIALLCAVATWPPGSPHLPSPENRHASPPG